MITDKELKEFYSNIAKEEIPKWKCRKFLDWAIHLFVKSQEKTLLQSIFGVSKKKQELYKPTEIDFKVLVHFGLISQDRSRITIEGREYYNQITSSNFVTPN